jgi:type I restriction enzyme S subunit
MKYFESQKRGATIQGITSETIKGLNIIIPPITLQNKFALIIEQIEKQKQLAEQNLIYSEALFNSLLQKAFNGELVTDDAEMKTNKKQTSLV